MEIMGQNEAAQVRNRDDVAVRLGLFVWDGEQIELDIAPCLGRVALRCFTPQECANYLAAAGYDAI